MTKLQNFGSQTPPKSDVQNFCPLKLVFWGLKFGRNHVFCQFWPYLHPPMIYVVGKPRISASIWHQAIKIWCILQAIRISGTDPDRLLNSSWHCVICPPGLHCNVRERKHTRYQNQYKSESWISMDNHHYRRWNWAPDGSDNANHQWWRAPLNVPSCARSTYSCARARTEHRLFQVLRQRSGNYGWGWEACGGDVCRVTQLAGHAIQNIVLFTSNHHHHLSFFFACWCGHHLIQN